MPCLSEFPRPVCKLSFLLAMGLSTACASLVANSDEDALSTHQGVKRTSLERWQTTDFSPAGVRVEYPAEAFYASGSPDGVGVGLHPVYPRPGVLSDARPLIGVRIERMSREEWAEKRRFSLESLEEEADEEVQSRVRWALNWHSSIESREGSWFRILQYDIECGDTSVVRMRVEFSPTRRDEVLLHEAEDEAAIRRILKSVACLEDWKPQ